ncbi:SMI1/KNR4 family protein [Clostridium butyricum]|uniref:SMI1/KNR4 family protein n=2 Tax=Clostridium TaxID=1485 RepID=UPI0011DDEE4F|nr:SMI1/KNR4 family protein [Clostridium butyricum]MBO1687739.1 SMI1/KNR4 family protein [Clostridium butyricum]MDB2140128.1 SMI1/KNR4 family protein [Clostridium butyricum]MDI9208245.1 SMI1/KNR4 family protein [Clostridium butyricum]
MKIKGYGNVKEEEILKLEDELGFTLPNDYKEFLINFNGGVPEVKYSTFKLNELEENIGLQVLYGLDLEENLDLREWYEEYEDDLLDDCLIIGHGIGFGFIVLVNSPEVSGVYFLDNSFELENSSEDENIYKISDTFREFIEELKSPVN